MLTGVSSGVMSGKGSFSRTITSARVGLERTDM